MLRLMLLNVLFIIISGEKDARIVILNEGDVRGEKYWNGDFYEFYEVPYASVPKGRDRFQGPLPVVPRNEILDAKRRNIICPQTHFNVDADGTDSAGEEECLVMNLLVPEVANKDNLVPVLVYIHSGAFAVGNGNMAKYHYLARHDVLVVSFNFRLGALGFVCLGTKEIPGNAGMKDQVAALRWINKNIKKFGGDPNKVTVAGFSVGAAMAELLTLSKSAEGLIDKLIIESGSALSPFAVNVDPLNTARNIAVSIGYNDTGKIEDLNEFYLNASLGSLCAKSLNFFLTNSTFGFAPCVENDYENIEAFLTDSPLDIMNNGDYKTVPVLTGFANMEGLSRLVQFDEWSEEMNKHFADFLPADLIFKNNIEKEKLTEEIKNYYFNNEDISHDHLQGYIDYFSDSMFKYSIIKSAKLHANWKSVYFYEFSYVGELNMKHDYMDRIRGASHRDQTAYLLEFYSWTNNVSDMDTRDRMTSMWTDFVKYEDPTAYESLINTIKWLKFTNENPHYLEIDNTLELKQNPFEEGYKFWDKIYKRYYWNPSSTKVKKKEKILKK